jgi:histone H3
MGEKINKMAHINERGAGKAPRHNNTVTRTTGAYRRAQSAKVRSSARLDMADLQEIRKYQKTTEMLIQKAPFQRLVREFIKKKGEIRVTLSALITVQESSRAHLAEYFQDVNLAAIHAGRVTIKDKDFTFMRSIRHEDRLSNTSTPGGDDEAHERQV